MAAKARVALEAVTAQDPEHLKVLSSYLTELENNYTRVNELLDRFEQEDDEDDGEDDPENMDADIIFNTRDWNKGGLTTKFRDAPAPEEGEISEVEAFPVFYPSEYQPLQNLKWSVRESSRPNKPSTLILDYGSELEELKKEPLFRGFKVLVHMADSDDEGDDDGDDASTDKDE